MQVSSSPRTGFETSCCARRRWAPLRPSRCARKCLRGPLPVCAPCGLPNAAAGGVVTRRSLQVYLPVLAHGRREMRSEVHQVACTLSHKGALDVGSMLLWSVPEMRPGESTTRSTAGLAMQCALHVRR